MERNEIIGFTIMGILNLPLFFIIAKFMFKDWETFKECFYYSLKPDWISLIQGEYWRDWVQQMRFSIWIMICVGIVAGEYFLLYKLLLAPVVE